MFRRFLSKLFPTPGARPVRPRRPATGSRPVLERLEDRCLLTAGVIQGSVLIDGASQPVSGATVYLDQNHNGILDNGDLSTATDANGNYSFTGLSAGSYTVAQVPPAALMQTTPAPSPGPGLLGEVTRDFNVAVKSPTGLAWVNGALFVSNRTTTVSQVDPATGSVLSSFTAPKIIFSLTFDGTNFWGADVDDNLLVQFNSTGALLATLPAPGAFPTGIAWDGQSLWVLSKNLQTIYQVNPATGAVLKSFATPNAGPNSFPVGLGFDGSHLWSTDWQTNLANELDPATGAVLRSFVAPRGSDAVNGNPRLSSVSGVAFDGQCLWMSQASIGHLFRVDISRPGSQTVTVADPGTASASFGDFQLGSVSGQVFNDLNGNGAQDAGEPGLAGWRVYLDGNGNGQYDFWEPSAVTDANGNYTITGLRANTYTLAESLRGPGWSQTGPAGQPYTVIINTSGQNLTGLNFGNHLSGVGPVGPESLVNVTTAGTQGYYYAAAGNTNGQVNTVAVDGQGDYVVVWQGNGPGDADGVFARVFDAAGNPRTGEVLVNVTTAGSQTQTAVAMDGSGDFAVAWDSGGQVWARVFSLSGAARTGQFQVSTKATSFVTGIAMDTAGDFSVLYGGPSPSINAPIWYFQRYNLAGQAQGAAVKVVAPTLIDGTSSIAMDGSGNLVVTWDDATSSNSLDVFAQRYSATGKKLGSTFTVNTTTAGIQWLPSAGRASSGAFVIAWHDRQLGAMMAQFFNADGTRNGGPIPIGPNAEQRTAVGMDASGNAVFAWSDRDNITGQRITAAGVAMENAFLVNTTIDQLQGIPSVAVTGSGTFVVSWSGNGVGDDAGVFAQRYAGSTGTLAPGGAGALTQVSSTTLLAAAVPVNGTALNAGTLGGAGGTTAPAASLTVTNAASKSAQGLPDAVLIQVLGEAADQGQVTAAAAPSGHGASHETIGQVFADLDLGTVPGLLG
jgi:hypothetical protein